MRSRRPRAIGRAPEPLEDYRLSNACEQDSLGLAFVSQPFLVSQVDHFGARMGPDLFSWRALAQT
jgi:hypothetical protein